MTAFTIDPEKRHARCNPRDPAFFGNPYPFYAALHAQCPAFFWEDYGHWCFAGWQDVNALFRDKRFGRQILHVATREELGWPAPTPHTADFDAADGHSLLYLEPPEHTRLRTLVNRAFVSRQVEHLRPKIIELANDLVAQIEPKGQAELIADFCAPIPVLIIAEMLGVPLEMGPQLLLWSHRMVRMYMFGRDAGVERDANQAAREFTDYLRKLADQKRKAPGNDLISYMITTEHKGQTLTEAELVSTSILLLNAGHEATVHQAGNAIKTVLESQYSPHGLFASDDDAERTVEECLRYDAPLHMFTRYALEDVDFGNGISVRKGDEIGLMIGAANRDPKQFVAADTFDPHRADCANINFGAGIHFCIGAPLARIELQSALKVLFERLPQIRLSAPPRYSDKYHFHGIDALKATWQ